MLIRTQLVLLTVLPLPCLAQSDAGAKALFLDPTSSVSVQASGAPSRSPVARKSSPVPTSAAQLPPPKEGDITGLRYWLELQTEQGQLLRVTSSRPFKSGERIRLHVESNVDGSLQVLQSQDGSPLARLFPTAGSSGLVEKFKDQVFPSKTGWFRFDSRPGDIRLILMIQPATQIPEAAPPVQVAANTRPPSTPPPVSSQQSAFPPTTAESLNLDSRVKRELEQLRGSKALVVEDDSGPDAANYVVVDRRRDSNAGPVVAVELKLSHR